MKRQAERMANEFAPLLQHIVPAVSFREFVQKFGEIFGENFRIIFISTVFDYAHSPLAVHGIFRVEIINFISVDIE
jgi:hypothetical protein